MTQATVQAIVLAAGKSSRFKTRSTKLVYTLCGQEMIMYPLQALQALEIPVTLVVGHQHEAIRAVIARHGVRAPSFVEQHEQRGTGDALLRTQPLWHADDILIMNGDMPLVSKADLQALYTHHKNTQSALTFVTAHVHNGGAYGRVVRSENGVRIVEARDFSGEVTNDCMINAGIYLVRKHLLVEYISRLCEHANSRELYITDLIGMMSDEGLRVTTYELPFDSVRGVNTLLELWAVEHIKRSEIIEYWMHQGVHFTHAQSTHVDAAVTLDPGVTIGLGAQLLGKTHVAGGSTIGSYSMIKNSTLADHVTVFSHTVVSDSQINAYVQVGPFAHIHGSSSIGSHTIIGNFVQVNRSTVEANSRAKHLSFIGDAHVGSSVNIGAGTITCNYDGFAKHKTVIENNVLIGSNNSLIAPLTIAQGSMTAAGSVITQDVPENALAIARARQVTKEGYAQKIRDSVSFVAAVKTKDTQDTPATGDTVHD